MKYLLDTCTISHFVKGHPKISKTLKATAPHFIFLSSISLMEIEYGLKLNPERASKLNPVIEALVSHVSILPFDEEDAKIAGSFRAGLQKLGTPIGAYDLLIASQAMRHGLVLITQNTKEFKRIPGLILEDWL